MRLSTKGRYAVTAMMDIALHERVGPVTLADISQCQGISLSYLEQLFAKLRRRELVQSIRGPGGGYVLGRPATAIYVAEIVDSVDETVDATRCAGKANCQHGEKCLTHELWSDLSDQIHHFLNGIDLESLIARRGVQQVAARQQHELIKLPAQEIQA